MIADASQIRGIVENCAVFSYMRERGCLYVDKTEHIYRLVRGFGKYYFLSRPRRFGKSLLVDTLNEYFNGSRELFEGLWIADRETEWVRYPVLRLNMSVAKSSVDDLQEYISDCLEWLEEESEAATKDSDTVFLRLRRVIRNAARRGPKLVVLIDEYDAPLQEAWGNNVKYEQFAEFYRNFFTILKAEEANLHFVFLTGCARFKNLNLFSLFNNLRDISFSPDYATVCGFTEAELLRVYDVELRGLADKLGTNVEGAVQRLRDMYDGYLFSAERPDIQRVYNPCDLCLALSLKSIKHYWQGTGGLSTYVVKFATSLVHKMVDAEEFTMSQSDLEMSDVCMTDPFITLYQAGYLTIEALVGQRYKLRIPNQEIRSDLFRHLLPLLGRQEQRRNETCLQLFQLHLSRAQLHEALYQFHLRITRDPSDNTPKECIQNEHRVKFYFAALCDISGFAAHEEQRQAQGIPDLVVNADDCYCYVLEFKRSVLGGVEEAWRQLNDNRYVKPHLDPKYRAVFAVAVEVTDDGLDIVRYRARRYDNSEGLFPPAEQLLEASFETSDEKNTLP